MIFGIARFNNSRSISRILVALLAIPLVGFFGINAAAQTGLSRYKLVSTFENRKVNSVGYQSYSAKITDSSAVSNGNSVEVSWSTESEINLLGFRIWRMNEGRMSLLSAEPVAARAFSNPSAPAFSGDNYLYLDNSSEALLDANASYYVEVIKTNNKSEWLGPIAIRKKDYEANNSSKAFFASPTLSEIQITSPRSSQVEKVENPETSLSNVAYEKFAPKRVRVFTPYTSSLAIKFEISRDGLYRVAGSELAARGFDPSKSSYWILSTDGHQEPMMVYLDGSIEFYGRGMDTIQTDRRVYWLDLVKTIGDRIPVSHYTFDSNAVSGTTRTTVEKKDRIYYGTGILNGDRENWFSAFVASFGTTQTLNLPEVAFGSNESVMIGVDLQGFDGTSHSVEVSLNGVVIGTLSLDPGQRIEVGIPTSVSNLREGNNDIRFRSLNGSSDYNFLEAVRVTYPRKLVAVGNSINFIVAANRKVKVDGFESSRVRVFDLFNGVPSASYVLQGVLAADGRYSVSIPRSSVTRTLVAQGESVAALSPVSIVQNVSSSLRSSRNGANFVVIAPIQFHAALQPLVNARIAQGIDTKLVDIVDVYDEFSGGARSADALKSFLEFAHTSWDVKPNYVMLVGDSSIDPRNYRGTPGDDANIIPTMFEDALMMEALTDDRIVDFDDDWHADMSIGRLPVRNASEVSSAVAKILVVSGMSSSLAVSRGASMVADLPVGYDFNLALQGVSTSLPSSMQVNYVSRSSSQADSITRQQVIDQVNQGRFVVNYHGHGLVGGWSGANLLQSGDGPILNNSNSPSLMLMLACLNGYYADISPNLAESMIRSSGGAFAVFADSGLYAPESNLAVSREIQTRFFAGERLGDAIRTAKRNAYDFPSPRTWILFGDPTTRLNP